MNKIWPKVPDNTNLYVYTLGVLDNIKLENKLIDLGEGVSLCRLSEITNPNGKILLSTQAIKKSKDLEKYSWNHFNNESIKELSPTFNVDLFDNYNYRFSEFYRDPDKSDCVIEIVIIKKEKSSMLDEANRKNNIIKNIITSLRIVDFSDVTINGLITFSYLDVRGASVINGPTNYGESYVTYGEPSILYLDQQKVSTLKTIYSVISGQIPKYFAFAQKKINDSHNRLDIFEKIIDIVIGLEALYMDGESNNISYKLAIRIAFDQETESSEIEKKYNQVKVIYSIRSKAVHGDEEKIKEIIRKSDFQSLKEIYEYSANILRLGCLGFIYGYNKYKDWKKYFDMVKKKMFYRNTDIL